MAQYGHQSNFYFTEALFSSIHFLFEGILFLSTNKNETNETNVKVRSDGMVNMKLRIIIIVILKRLKVGLNKMVTVN